MVGESMKPSKTHRMKEPEEGFDMAILPPRETGLPFVVFILQDIGIIPEVRIEIARSHRVPRSETVKVGNQANRLFEGWLPRRTRTRTSDPLGRSQPGRTDQILGWRNRVYLRCVAGAETDSRAVTKRRANSRSNRTSGGCCSRTQGRYLHSVGYSRSSHWVGMQWETSDGPEQHIREVVSPWVPARPLTVRM